VLCDLPSDTGINTDLLNSIPADTKIFWDYGRRSSAHKRRLDARDPKADAGQDAPRSQLGLLKRIEKSLPPSWIPDPEFLPLGEHSLDIPHALRAARKIIKNHPIEAIVVNADPYAAMLVGAKLARETGLPLVQDLRDPWALCSLRRPRRRSLQRAIVDRLERWSFEAASAIVLNTETALRDYVDHYVDMPSDRFSVIRNHGDRDLIGNGHYPRSAQFTMLFFGNFRRFVEGHSLIDALGELKKRGIDGDQAQLLISGECPQDVKDRAEKLGVIGMLKSHPFVPYLEAGSFMAASDLLISLSNDTKQRIPAKFFDYATTERPILVVGDTPELIEMTAALPGAYQRGRLDSRGIADAMEIAIRGGPQQCIARPDTGLDSQSASKKLASILDRVAH